MLRTTTILAALLTLGACDEPQRASEPEPATPSTGTTVPERAAPMAEPAHMPQRVAPESEGEGTVATGWGAPTGNTPVGTTGTASSLYGTDVRGVAIEAPQIDRPGDGTTSVAGPSQPIDPQRATANGSTAQPSTGATTTAGQPTGTGTAVAPVGGSVTPAGM